MEKIIHGDCLEVMREMPNDSVDMVLTSPPYNMNLRIRNGKYCSRQIVKELSTKYKNFDDNLPMDEYLDFNRKVLRECFRVAPIVFYNVQFLTGNKVALFKLMGEFAEQLKEVIVWDKVNAQPAIGEGVMNSQFEVLLVFEREGAISRKFSNANFGRGTLTNLWNIKRGRRETDTHGAVFPEELAERVLKNFCPRGGTALDPLMGTGTTGVVCKKNNLSFIGIEISEEYCEIARKRLSPSHLT